MTVKFTDMGKTSRLFRNITISEKIDGTNGAIGVLPIEEIDRIYPEGLPEHAEILDTNIIADVTVDGQRFGLYAQSRNKLLSLKYDNAGFAGWVSRNAEPLARHLGKGLHFGEWWGSGIQRAYGLKGGEKRFSLFNTRRHKNPHTIEETDGLLQGVPVLYEGVFDQEKIENALWLLRHYGSVAQQGYMNPEGICIFHTSSGTVSKVTLDNNDKGKWEE